MKQTPSLLDAVPDTMLRIDRSGAVLDAHLPADCPLPRRPGRGADIRQTGLPEEALGRLQSAIRAVLETAVPERIEALVNPPQGSRHLEIRVRSGGTDQVVVIFRDITASKHAATRSLQAERLAAIGQMVAGLAHESRNAFQRCQAYLEVLAMEVEDRPEALELVERIQETQDHLHYLYEEVRSYAAPIKLDLHPVELRALWRATWEHLETVRGDKEVVLVDEPDGAVCTCQADPNALEQVFRNVLENAVDACPEPGVIEIRCQPAWVDGAEAVEVRVLDNGPGLEPAARGKVFEPFFTTKTTGTGLGMAIARRLVEAHHGRIGIEAASATGTEVVITLPRSGAPSGPGTA